MPEGRMQRFHQQTDKYYHRSKENQQFQLNCISFLFLLLLSDFRYYLPGGQASLTVMVFVYLVHIVKKNHLFGYNSIVNNYYFSCNMRLLFISIVLIGSMLNGIAADKKDAASLSRELKSAPDGNEKTRILLDLSEALETDSAQAALKYALAAKDLAESLNNPVYLAFSFVRMGNAFLSLSAFRESKINLEKGLELLKQLNSKEPNRNDINMSLAEAYYGLGLADYYLGDFEQSVIAYQDALRKYTALNDRQKVANIYQNMGLVHSDLKNAGLSLEYYFKSLDLNRKLNNKTNIAGLTQNIGLFYYGNQDYPKASAYINESLKTYKELDDKEGIASSFSNLGLIFQSQGEYAKALGYFREAYRTFSGIGYTPGIITTQHNIGTAFSDLGEFNPALLSYQKSLRMADSMEYTDLVLTNYEAISNLYTDFKDFQKALEYQTSYYRIKDSIYSGESRNKIAELEAAYSLEVKEGELANQQIKLKQQKIQKYLLIGGICTAFVFLLFLVIAYRKKSKMEKQLTQHKKNLELLVEQKTEELKTSHTERRYALESDRLKSAFLANMSHELRTPMNAIIAFSNFLKDPQIIPEKRDEYINYITTAGDTLLHLVDDIIDSAKIESKQLTINRVRCNITDLLFELREIFSEIRGKKQRSHLELKISEASRKDDVYILTDPLRLKQVLSNLLENALKYTTEGFIEFGYVIETTSVTFFVKDTGIGIPKDKFGYIFQRFSQIEYTVKDSFRGTGLGLSITKNLVELLGGSIWVESEMGTGSTFYFTIPSEKIESEPRPFGSDKKKVKYDKAQLFDWSNKNVLVAEDEDLNYKVLESVLTRAKANVWRAKDGLEAVEVCQATTIDLVLMDIQMPRMDGYAATHKIKQFNKNLPIIAQTSYAMTGERENCLAAGCDDYLSKPLNLEELLIKCNRYLSSAKENTGNP
jgi:signal transduction histidine kinase/ActR/RegA family two-component response regulator